MENPLSEGSSVNSIASINNDLEETIEEENETSIHSPGHLYSSQIEEQIAKNNDNENIEENLS